MKNIKTTKLQRVEVPVQHQESEGCVAFQMVKFEYSFFGSNQVDFLDTKILSNGKQIVISGNGYIKDGFELN